MKWIRVQLFNTIHWFAHSEVVTSITIKIYSLICTQGSGYEYYYSNYSLICTQWSCHGYYYSTLFIDLHKVKWLRVLPFNTIHWFAHSEVITSITIQIYSLICTQWNGYKYYYSTLFIDLHLLKWLQVLLFNTIHWFAHSEVVRSITIQNYSLNCTQSSGYGYYYSTLFIDLHTVKWLGVLLFKTIHWIALSQVVTGITIQHYSLICTQWSGYEYYYSALHTVNCFRVLIFNTLHLFAHGEVVTSITIQHYSLICTQWNGYNYYYSTLFIDFHSVKWLRVLLFNSIHWFALCEVVTNITIQHYSLICTQWSGYGYFYSTLFIDLHTVKWLRVLLFITIHWFALSEVVTSITIQHYSLSCTQWSGYEYYYLTLFIDLQIVKWLRVLLFNTIYWFAHSEVVTSITI